jgi:uncharacterized phosphosugar-binding protein
MNAVDRYLQLALAQMQAVIHSQRADLERAAALIADALASDRFLYAFGTGHSHMMAEEIFYRAGGLARACPILEPELMLHVNAAESTNAERRSEFALEILSRHPIERGDVLVIVSNSGRNAVPIEMAIAARERGIATIGITSFAHSSAFPPRHASGKRLREVVDVALDNHAVVGDAALLLPGMSLPIGATSTMTGALLMNTLVIRAVERLIGQGRQPEIYASSNTDSAAHNEAILQRYRGRIRCL